MGFMSRITFERDPAIQTRKCGLVAPKATDWQNHSIRGFLSAQVWKKMDLKVKSTKSEVGERTYRIE